MPLLISVPGQRTAGEATSGMVELIDLYPTLADLAGLERPVHLEGHSLRPLIEDPRSAWSYPAYTQVQRGDVPGHSVRNERWRYTEWGFGENGAELYDHESDPQELHNLASDPDYAHVVEQMKELLERIHPSAVEGGHAAADTRARYSDGTDLG